MTSQNVKNFIKREKIYRRTACDSNKKLIQTTGCVGTACWYHCAELCEQWEIRHKKHWGMHDDYNKYNPFKAKRK